MRALLYILLRSLACCKKKIQYKTTRERALLKPNLSAAHLLLLSGGEHAHTLLLYLSSKNNSASPTALERHSEAEHRQRHARHCLSPPPIISLQCRARVEPSRAARTNPKPYHSLDARCASCASTHGTLCSNCGLRKLCCVTIRVIGASSTTCEDHQRCKLCVRQQACARSGSPPCIGCSRFNREATCKRVFHHSTREHIQLLLDLPLVRRDAVPVVRRFSGGGTVVVGKGSVMATFIANKDDAPCEPFPRERAVTTGVFLPLDDDTRRPDYALDWTAVCALVFFRDSVPSIIHSKRTAAMAPYFIG